MTPTPVILGVAERISQMVRMPLENAEPFQIVHYDVGQKYDYHFDSFDTSDAEYFDGYVKTGGQRLLTVLGYLRDVPSGGETGFNRLGLNVQPRMGSIIVWYNCKPETNERDEFSQHAGLPVLEERSMLSIFGFVRRNLVMITRKEFTEQVEKLLVGNRTDIMSAILKVCEINGVEPEGCETIAICSIEREVDC